MASDLIANPDAFPILRHWDFFNHAGVSPLPRVAADALRQYCLEAERGAYLDTHWFADLEGLRKSAAMLINADPAEIAFIKNTSEGLSLVANGLDWTAGDRIVTTNVEYPANIYPWMDIARRHGVELVMVEEIADLESPIADSTFVANGPSATKSESAIGDSKSAIRKVPLDHILRALDHPRTRLLTLSHVEYASAQRHDLVTLGQFCRSRNILFCVNAIQTLGVLPVDVRAMNIDYLSADGHKWLLGPEGAGFFYIRKDLIERTRPSVVGWLNVINPLDFGHYDFTYKPNAGRYEPGSYNVPGFLALKASTELLLGVGIDQIAARVRSLGDRLVAGLEAKGYHVVSPRAGNDWSGSVCFVSPHHDHNEIVRKLRLEHRLEIALRENRLRCSPHFYNSDGQIDRLIRLLPNH